MKYLNDFANEIIKSKDSADSLIIYKNGHGYIVNKKREDVFDVRSISKTVLSLACGILINKNPEDFNLETNIYPIIKDKINLTNTKNLRYLKEINVGHLLTHTTGYRDLVLLSKDLREKDYDQLVDYIINYPIYYIPGSYFLYSNAGYYLLALTMQEFLNYDLLDFIYENLFKPLDIPYRNWDRFGNHIAGATKLQSSAYDLLKIGKLILNKGKYNGMQIVSEDYIKLMQEPLKKNRHESKREFVSEDYYGLGLWISEANVIFASGTGGQLIVILKDLDIVIVTTNNGSDSKSYKIKADADELIKLIYRENNHGL